MTNNQLDYGVVLTTVASQELGVAIAKALLAEKLAACINIIPIESLYTWQAEINHEREWQLVIKTRLSLMAELSAKITSLHDYEVPEIVALPIVEGSKPYLAWLASSLKI